MPNIRAPSKIPTIYSLLCKGFSILCLEMFFNQKWTKSVIGQNINWKAVAAAVPFYALNNVISLPFLNIF